MRSQQRFIAHGQVISKIVVVIENIEVSELSLVIYLYLPTCRVNLKGLIIWANCKLALVLRLISSDIRSSQIC